MGFGVNLFKTVFTGSKGVQRVAQTAEHALPKSEGIVSQLSKESTDTFMSLKTIPQNTFKKAEQFNADIQTLKAGGAPEEVINKFKTTRNPIKYNANFEYTPKQKAFIEKTKVMREQEALDKELAKAKENIEQKAQRKVAEQKAKVLEQVNNKIDSMKYYSHNPSKDLKEIMQHVPEGERAEVLMNALKRNDNATTASAIKSELVDVINKTGDEKMRASLTKELKNNINELRRSGKVSDDYFLISEDVKHLINLNGDKKAIAAEIEQTLSTCGDAGARAGYINGIRSYLESNPKDRSFYDTINSSLHSKIGNNATAKEQAYRALATMDGNYYHLRDLLQANPTRTSLLRSLLQSAKTESQKKDCAQFVKELCNSNIEGFNYGEIFSPFLDKTCGSWVKSDIIKPLASSEVAQQKRWVNQMIQDELKKV